MLEWRLIKGRSGTEQASTFDYSAEPFRHSKFEYIFEQPGKANIFKASEFACTRRCHILPSLRCPNLKVVACVPNHKFNLSEFFLPNFYEFPFESLFSPKYLKKEEKFGYVQYLPCPLSLQLTQFCEHFIVFLVFNIFSSVCSRYFYPPPHDSAACFEIQNYAVLLIVKYFSEIFLSNLCTTSNEINFVVLVFHKSFLYCFRSFSRCLKWIEYFKFIMSFIKTSYYA